MSYLNFDELSWTIQEKIRELPDSEPYWERGTRMAKRCKETVFNVTERGWLFISIRGRNGVRLATSRDIRKLFKTNCNY